MSLTAFATVSDLQAGWRTLSESEQTIATTLLLRATAQLTALLNAAGIEVDSTDEVQTYNLKTVTCNMVRRSMSAGDAEGISSMQQTIGSTSASVQWSNPSGAFFLSKTDKQVLGLLGSGLIWSIPAATAFDTEDD